MVPIDFRSHNFSRSLTHTTKPTMTIALFSEEVKDRSLRSLANYEGQGVDEACEAINSATKGLGADRQKVIDAIGTMDQPTRMFMALRYKELYGKEMVDVLKKNFSGDLGLALQYLAVPSDEAECRMLKDAMDGIGCAQNVVCSILLGRTNEELQQIKKTYFALYSKDLGQRLASELGGVMEKVVVSAYQGSDEVYDPHNMHSAEKAIADAQLIHEKGQKSWRIDERGIFKIICASPIEHLKNIDRAYLELYGQTLMAGVERFGGFLCKAVNGALSLATTMAKNAKEKDLTSALEQAGILTKSGEQGVKDATLYLLGMRLEPYKTMAQLIKSACAGYGTDERMLTCCIIRYQNVMLEVNAAHVKLYKKSIHERVRSEAGGKYKVLLLQILETTCNEHAHAKDVLLKLQQASLEG